jgi:hypothetical protein
MTRIAPVANIYREALTDNRNAAAYAYDNLAFLTYGSEILLTQAILNTGMCKRTMEMITSEWVMTGNR